MHGVLLLRDHAKVVYVNTTPEHAHIDFAHVVCANMSRGTFERTPLSVSFYTDHVSVMLLGEITNEIYARVRRHLHIEITRENGFGVPTYGE